MPNIEYTAVVTSDTAVKASLGIIHWIVASAAATGGRFQINDSTDDSGTDMIDVSMPANSVQHFYFGNSDRGGLECKTGIYADVPGSNIILNIGYV